MSNLRISWLIITKMHLILPLRFVHVRVWSAPILSLTTIYFLWRNVSNLRITWLIIKKLHLIVPIVPILLLRSVFDLLLFCIFPLDFWCWTLFVITTSYDQMAFTLYILTTYIFFHLSYLQNYNTCLNIWIHS